MNFVDSSSGSSGNNENLAGFERIPVPYGASVETQGRGQGDQRPAESTPYVRVWLDAGEGTS
jgi:hypothetical protein